MVAERVGDSFRRNEKEFSVYKLQLMLKENLNFSQILPFSNLFQRFIKVSSLPIPGHCVILNKAILFLKVLSHKITSKERYRGLP